jgi:hypothetical protein
MKLFLYICLAAFLVACSGAKLPTLNVVVVSADIESTVLDVTSLAVELKLFKSEFVPSQWRSLERVERDIDDVIKTIEGLLRTGYVAPNILALESKIKTLQSHYQRAHLLISPIFNVLPTKLANRLKKLESASSVIVTRYETVRVTAERGGDITAPLSALLSVLRTREVLAV